MIQRGRFINFLREQGFSYKDQSDRTVLYRRSSDTKEVWLRRKEDPLSEAYVRSTLRQCGIDGATIEQFIANNTSG